MKPLTAEWVAKAEHDWVSAQREFRARKAPNYDAACFFAQQCVEKYLKARLQEADIRFPKTHDLAALLARAAPIEAAWREWRQHFEVLSVYAVETRYPGMTADRSMAREAVRMCRVFRGLARASLRLKP